MKSRLSNALLLLAAVSLLALAASPVFGDDGGNDKAEKARKKHTNGLMANPNVVGVGLAFRPDGGNSAQGLASGEGREAP